MPFVLLLFGIMSVCLYYFADFSMENATWQAARAIRTGQLQQSQGAYAGAVTNADRKKPSRRPSATRPSCSSTATPRPWSSSRATPASAASPQPNCATNGVMINQTPPRPSTPARASSVVLVTVCYPWEFGGKLPLFKIGNLQGGALLMQASAAFRTEPYN